MSKPVFLPGIPPQQLNEDDILKPMMPEYQMLRRYALAQKLLALEQATREQPQEIPQQIPTSKLLSSAVTGIGIPYFFPKVQQALGILSVPLAALGGASLHDILMARQRFMPAIPMEGPRNAY